MEYLHKHEEKTLVGMISDFQFRYQWVDILTEDHFTKPEHIEVYKRLKEYKNLEADNLMINIEIHADNNMYDICDLLDKYELEKSFCLENHSPQELQRFKRFRDISKAYMSINPMNPQEEEITALQDAISETETIKEDIGGYKEAYMGVYRLASDKTTKSRLTPSGNEIYDELLDGGISKGLHIIGARPNGCKTTLALDVSMDYAMTNKNELSIFFSLEVGAEDLWYKMVSNRSEIDYKALQNRFNSREVSNRIQETASKILTKEKNNFVYVSCEGLSASRIKFISEKIAQEREMPVGLITVDYLQIMNTNGSKPRTETERVQTVSNELRILARNNKVIALAQVNRDGDNEECPETKHIKGSSQIEQDAVTVVFLWWRNKSLCEIAMGIKKNRYGESERFINATLLGSIGKFKKEGDEYNQRDIEAQQENDIYDGY